MQDRVRGEQGRTDAGERQPWLRDDRRPAGVSDDVVEATGKLSEALEWVERARGRLYDFHQLSGRADLLAGEAADLLDQAGEHEWAERLRRDLIGRNVLEGRWTFQIVEEYDATYWEPARALRAAVEADLVGGQPHVFESEMKEDRRTAGRRHHETGRRRAAERPSAPGRPLGIRRPDQTVAPADSSANAGCSSSVQNRKNPS